MIRLFNGITFSLPGAVWPGYFGIRTSVSQLSVFWIIASWEIRNADQQFTAPWRRLGVSMSYAPPSASNIKLLSGSESRESCFAATFWRFLRLPGRHICEGCCLYQVVLGEVLDAFLPSIGQHWKSTSVCKVRPPAIWKFSRKVGPKTGTELFNVGCVELPNFTWR